MKSDLHHLPDDQRNEIGRAVKTLLTEFDVAKSNATQSWKKNGSILKIILFGSYSRTDWVDDPDSGYQSDYDLLIIVSHPDLTDIADYWYNAEDKLLRDQAVKRQVNIIVHTLDEVNQALKRGEYFWVDIVRDGITLYELNGSSFTAPQPLTAADALVMTIRYFDEWLPGIDRSLSTAQDQIRKGENDLGWRKDAAFSLHQGAERAYICALLVKKLYFPRSHNVKFLRSLAEDGEPRLTAAWPRASRIDRRRFELLKRAYVEARYSDAYVIETEDLEALMGSVKRLRDLVDAVSSERINELRAQAGL